MISVTAFGVIGGGAVIAAGGSIAGVQTVAALGLGIGELRMCHSYIPYILYSGALFSGNLFTQSMCTFPYCKSDNGQCCLLVTSPHGIKCPDSC